ncbi:hypothetical protein PSm6_29170 [Pseudomonas solani]|uniref:Peptidase C13 n=1 Tax=Pseudomonas solani TaxID=2731552 RepID=A0ABM7LAA1_9PSED|nr:C13 family peptidase [Pseudomonas solani]BCD86510.1 hypothetical protein PSm6_29170 [Pseudomonas solani]
MKPLLPLALALLLAACGDGEPLTPPDARLPDGSRYRGAVVDGLLQGPGRLDYSNGTWFEGTFKDGQPNGRGTWHGPNGVEYQGDFSNGLFDGNGHMTYGDGTLYEGGFKANQFNGEGTLSREGMVYSGTFRDDRYHGQGKLTLPDGSSYQGQFKRGEQTGRGVRTDADGSRYSGPFKAGQLDGEGDYQGADGGFYSGGFKGGLFDGKGRYQNAEGSVWSGQFKGGSLTGKGEYKGADGELYTGAFRNWRYQGEGSLSLADGSRYEGGFAAGRYAGKGTLTLADGGQEKGTWRGGRRIGDETGKALPNPLEVGLLEQGRLLDAAIDALPASTPAVELYSLSLGGDGRQSVFLREADYVATLLDQRFGAHGHITLINHRDHMADRPLATRESLARAIQGIAQRSGPEDLVFIYLTSHGSADHQLALEQPGLQLGDLPASELATVLAPLKERHKVVVISACYSGGFIPALKDDKTLVMTAARADRVSFGCSDDNEFTYFGRALLADALNQTDDLERAFELARTEVAEWEKADGFEPSEPQIWAPKPVLAHWRKLRAAQAQEALAAQPATAGGKTAASH